MRRLHDGNKFGRNAVAAVDRDGFSRSEDGSLIIFGLMIFILMLTAGGMGVDFMRFEAQRSRLQATLDRAVLAAASLDQPLDAKDVVVDYFERAGLGDHINRDDIDVVESPIMRSVDATVTMDVPSMFLNFVGINKLTAPAAATAQQMASQTEISLVLDVSGSMGSTSPGTDKDRIEILQESAATFINMLMCDPKDTTQSINCTVPKGTVAMNIVPYAEQVSVGADLSSYLNFTSEHTSSSCAHFEADDYLTVGISDTTTIQRAGHFDPWSRGDNAWDWACPTNAAREIMAFEDDVPTLQAKISALNADGNTSIDLGMKWGAALLDPDFHPVVTALIDDNKVSNVYEDFPLTWDTRGVNKVLVLMTDGQNTSEHYLYDAFRSGPSPVFFSNDADASDRKMSLYDAGKDRYFWPYLEDWEDYPQNRPYGAGKIPSCKKAEYLDQPWKWSSKCDWVDGPGATAMTYPEVWATYSWDWWDEWDFLPNPGSSYGTSTKNSRLADICATAKADGMTIFTIGFDTRWNEETLLRSCAEGKGEYFDANGLDLANAFAEIARQVSKLQLVN